MPGFDYDSCVRESALVTPQEDDEKDGDAADGRDQGARKRSNMPTGKGSPG